MLSKLLTLLCARIEIEVSPDRFVFKGVFSMRRIFFSTIVLILAQVGVVSAIDIAPQFKAGETVYYRIETIEEYPPKADRRFIVHESYMASVNLRERTEREFILEWNYLPVKNPIIECFMKEEDGCHMWTSDIKQILRIVYRLNSDGMFGGFVNGDDIPVQIGSIFEHFTNNHKRYSKMKSDSLNSLKESVMFDESILREFLELHGIYGNSVQNNKFTENSRIREMSEILYDTFETQIELDREFLTIGINGIKADSPEHIKRVTHDYKWKISLKNMIIESLVKYVELNTDRGIRKFSLIISRTKQPEAN